MSLRSRLAERLFARLTRTVASRAPDFCIGKGDDIYLRRWFVLPRNRLFNIYLHQFLRSDDDRALHDHPWCNLSFVLRGIYVEHTIPQGGIQRRRHYIAGDIRLRSAWSAHRIELINGPCWSLFVTGPRMREWGFHCPRGWRHWKDFTNPHNSGEIGRGCD